MSRRPGQPDLKPCALKGCTSRVPRSKAFCPTHWEMLPRLTQGSITDAWAKKQFHALPRLVAGACQLLRGGAA